MNAPSAPQPARLDWTTYRSFLKIHRVLGLLGMVAFLNLLLFLCLNIFLGGDSLGILPSKDGFIVNNHGHHTAVSQSVWVFSLFHSAATLLLTPIIFLTVASRLYEFQIKKEPLRTKCLLGAFVVLFLLTLESSILRSACQSWDDWSHLKSPSAGGGESLPPENSN
jgi:hypothetical protein